MPAGSSTWAAGSQLLGCHYCHWDPRGQEARSGTTGQWNLNTPTWDARSPVSTRLTTCLRFCDFIFLPSLKMLDVHLGSFVRNLSCLTRLAKTDDSPSTA